MVNFQHHLLGKVRGKLNNGIVQFSGIKYASLRHRFGSPELYEGNGLNDIVDATRLGPGVIGVPDGAQAEFKLIQHELDLPDFPPQSDIEGLNLTVTAPDIKTHGLLPVFVFIHGGALAMGSSSWPQYDHAAFVRHSVELGKPIIGVNINYRTGIFGFLTSEELRNKGYKANNGLRDQAIAFQWVKKYISGFGGDPHNVTAIGQSAGGVSATLLLQSQEPLFQRLVDLSGTCLLLRPLPLAVHEVFYDQFVEIHGLTGLSSEERLAAIENISSHQLLLKLPPSLPSLPALDNDFIHTSPTFSSVEEWHTKGDQGIPGLDWCKELLIGDCQLDGHIYQLALNHRQEGIARQLEESLKRNIPDKHEQVDSLLMEYGISTAQNRDDAYLRVLQFSNDIAFYLPEAVLAKNFPGTTYVYHLNIPNPWDGAFKDQVTHIFDVVLLFKNFDQHLPMETLSAAKPFTDNIIKFINGGEAPWKATTTQQPIALVYELGKTGKLVEDSPENVGRRSTIFKFKNSIGFDALHKAFIAFLGGN